jgi:ankyrin repeat protein
MLEHGWNPNLYGHNEIHPLTVAAASFPLSTVKILLDHGVSTRGTQAMHAATTNAANDETRFKVLDLLLQYGGDINEMEVDPKGRAPPRQRTGFTGTPLHHAIHADSVEAVRYLLARGASKMAPSWSGQNALKVAEGSKRTQIAEVIRSWP